MGSLPLTINVQITKLIYDEESYGSPSQEEWEALQRYGSPSEEEEKELRRMATGN